MSANRFKLSLFLFVLLVVAIITVAAVTHTGSYFTQTEILQDSNSTWLQIQGECECRVFGTFGGATADMQTAIQGTNTVTNVEVVSLIGITKDTTFESIRLGHGSYRIAVTGGNGATDLTFHCRRVM